MLLDYKRIGKRIQTRRRAKHITQERMAEDLDFSVGFISQVERGVTKLSLDSLYEISEYLDCSVGDIIDKDSSHENAFQQMEWNILYERLPAKEQRLLYYMLKAYIDNR